MADILAQGVTTLGIYLFVSRHSESTNLGWDAFRSLVGGAKVMIL